MTQLLLVRHAHNDWLKDRLAGWTPGVSLNDEGRVAAAALAERLASHRIDAVYASPLERARETAAYLAEPRGLSVVIEPAVGEVRCGTWTGRSLDEVSKDPLWAALHYYPSGTRFPEGETLAEVQCRVIQALEAIVAAHPDGAVAVVTHADVIKVAVAHYAGMHIDMMQRLVVAPASLSVVHTTLYGPRLMLLNDAGAVPPPPDPPQPPGGTTTGEPPD